MLGIITVIASTLISGIAIHDASASTPFTVTCDGSSWVGTPAMNDQGRLAATITSQCKLVLSAAGSIASLDTHLLASIPTGTGNTINSGPTAETFQNLPSVYFDITNKSLENGDNVTMRSDFHIASDQTTQLIDVNQATQIAGTGNAAYLKVFSDEEDVTMSATEANTFTFKETQSVELEKPWYAPSGIFVSEAEKSLKADFDKNIQASAQTTAQQLLDAAETE